MGVLTGSRAENERQAPAALPRAEELFTPGKEPVNIPPKAACERIIHVSRRHVALTRIDASFPTWVSKLRAGCLWQRWKEALYGILYFLLHLDGLIDL